MRAAGARHGAWSVSIVRRTIQRMTGPRLDVALIALALLGVFACDPTTPPRDPTAPVPSPIDPVPDPVPDPAPDPVCDPLPDPIGV